MQTVQIEGMPPFLFTEDSDIYGIAASTQNQSTSTGNRRGQRSQSSGTSQTNRGTDSRTTAPEADPVETVQSHRTQFNSSFDEFYEVLEVAADETTSSSDILASWDAMLAIASDWQQYPVDAATVSFSRNQTDLEDAYLHWADCVADLGASFDQFYANTATVDDFLVVYDVLLIADSELGSVLRSYNSRSSVIRNRTSAIAASMKSVASSRMVLA